MIRLAPELWRTKRIHNDLGIVLQALGDLAGAKAGFERALKIDEGIYAESYKRMLYRLVVT